MDSLAALLGLVLAVWVASGFRGARFDWLSRSTGLEQRFGPESRA